MHLQFVSVVLLLAACQTPAVSLTGETAEVSAGQVAANDSPAQPSVQDAPKAKTAKAKADEVKKKQKELRNKIRELKHAAIEHRIAKIGRDVKGADLRAATQKAAADAEAAKKALELFLGKQRPREIDQHEIRVDRRTHAADHAKDELGELTAMYDQDEFAKATKELVLKRGRRSLEMAQRELAVAKEEFAEFREYTLPKRERELQRKLADAERAIRKADMEASKNAMADQLALIKEQERIADIEEAIGELQKELEGKS